MVITLACVAQWRALSLECKAFGCVEKPMVASHISFWQSCRLCRHQMVSGSIPGRILREEEDEPRGERLV